MSFDVYQQRADDEQLQARRALLTRHSVSSADPLFVLIRRHEEQLRKDFRHHAGYTLRVGADHARLVKTLDPETAARTVRAPAVTASERNRSLDERPVMDRRRMQFVALACAVLERRTLGQIPVRDLADEVARVAAELGVAVDWKDAAARQALVHAVTFLEHHGALVHRSGRREAFQRGDDEHESLYDIRRGALAGLLADPAAIMTATCADDLTRPPAAISDGQARDHMRRRLIRLLIEQPCVYLADLADDERQYFLAARRAIEDAAATLTGLQVERRAEGTALVTVDREMTDLPFPARSNTKQIALMLCPYLAAHPQGQIPRDAALGYLRTLIADHGASWGLTDADDATLEAKLDDAARVLADLHLVDLAEADALRVLPALHRFRTPSIHRPETP